ncbi:uncharacterized protein CFAP92 [Spea bombifrons]|uniref:uncharacterized protein CFAP92 n=1 Tax=Spea bombifrons TaxID=233779 RepID=UPI00234A75BE|nr:uncharacterized protein CFAP92 [Spea bombifrons]
MLIDSPRPQGYYHFEYHLLPEHTEPTKVDVVLFGAVAKIYMDHESRILRPWREAGRLWLLWSHSVELRVTNSAIMKTLNHQMKVKIWDSKDKVSPRARFDKPKAFRVTADRHGDTPDEKRIILNQRKMFEDGRPGASFMRRPAGNVRSAGGDPKPQELPSVADPTTIPPNQRSFALNDDFAHKPEEVNGSPAGTQSLETAPRTYRFQAATSEELRAAAAISDGTRGRRKSLDAVTREDPERECLTVGFTFMPFLAGDVSVTERLRETSHKVLDGYVTLAINPPLLSEEQRMELNPLVIRIISATSLPTTPTAIRVLQETCRPVYCRYRFHRQPVHQTHGQKHGTHVYFKDVNVILAGTFNPGELREYLSGPPVEIEVHDRDRRSGEPRNEPSLYGTDPEDEKLSNVGLVESRRTVHNPFAREKRGWDPYGVAKIGLSELVHGAKCLNLRVPIHNCAAPDPTGYVPDSRNGRIIGVMRAVDGPRDVPLPPGHYVDAQSHLKVRVDVAAPLSVEGEASDCPYGRIIFMFHYENKKLLRSIIGKIMETNVRGLNPRESPCRDLPGVLAKVGLTDQQKEDPSLDVITGIHVMDGTFHLFVLEGLKAGGIRKLWESLSSGLGWLIPHWLCPVLWRSAIYLPRACLRFIQIGSVAAAGSAEATAVVLKLCWSSRRVPCEDGKLATLFNSRLTFRKRIYKDLDVLLTHVHLRDHLSSIVKQPLIYVRDRVPSSALKALSRLDFICGARNLTDVFQSDLLPSADMVRALSCEFGLPVSLTDVFSVAEDLFPENKEISQDGGKRPDIKTRTPCRSLDNYNAEYIKWKRNQVSHRDHIQSNVENLLELSQKIPKIKAEYVVPVPGDVATAHNYSSQTFNSTEIAHRVLRQAMAAEPKQRFTYSPGRQSAAVSPVDIKEQRKLLAAKSKETWLTAAGFEYPGFRSSTESNEHPKKPHAARIAELGKVWKENILHANTLQPTLTRDRWSWGRRRGDFDLYGKYQDAFSFLASGAVHLAGETPEGERLASEDEHPKMKFYRRLPQTELVSRGPKAGDQQSKLCGLLKDAADKLSLCRPGLALEPIPALAVLRGTGDSGICSGFAPGEETKGSLKMDRNTIPRRSARPFQRTSVSDFSLHANGRSTM